MEGIKMEEIKKDIDKLVELADAQKEIFNKYNGGEVKVRDIYRLNGFAIDEGFFTVAEALGVEPKPRDVSIIHNNLCKQYCFDYKGYSFYSFIKIANTEEL